MEHVGNDGKQVYNTKYYNLDMIISIGFRVKANWKWIDTNNMWNKESTCAKISQVRKKEIIQEA